MRRPFGSAGPATTAAGLAAQLGDAAAVASYIWPEQELSGNLVDTVSAEEMAAFTSTLQGQTASGTGLSGGMVGRVCTEFATGNNSFVASDVSVMEHTGSSRAFLFIYQAAVSVSALSLMGKGRPVSASGCHVGIGGGTGKLTGYLYGSSGNASATHASNTADNVWRAGALVLNHTTNLAHIYVSGTVPPAGVSIAAAGSFADPTGGLYIGRGRFSAVASQQQYLACFEGVAAEAINQAAVDAFWTAVNA